MLILCSNPFTITESDSKKGWVGEIINRDLEIKTRRILKIRERRMGEGETEMVEKKREISGSGCRRIRSSID